MNNVNAVPLCLQYSELTHNNNCELNSIDTAIHFERTNIKQKMYQATVVEVVAATAAKTPVTLC